MNPEIRFRVPEHVHQLANRRALELGLRHKRGRTGGASELARCALYTFLGLGLPDETELGSASLESVRTGREELEEGDSQTLRVTVYHRVCQEYRTARGLEGRAVAARRTTEFQFVPGELPDFLVPYVLLTERGNPFVALNLEGSLSPRKKALGELVSASEHATLGELKACLCKIAFKKKERERERLGREEQQIRGLKTLETWSHKHGSELLRARLKGGFEWTALACSEYTCHELAKLGLKDLTPLPTTQSLESAHLPYHNIRSSREPALESLQTMDRLKDLADQSLEFQIVLVDDVRTGITLEGVQISIKLPIPGRLHFLTSLHNQRG